MAEQSPQLIIPSTRLFKGKKYPVELHLPVGFREARQLTPDIVRESLYSARCYRSCTSRSCINEHEVFCPHCGRVVVIYASNDALSFRVEGSTEIYCAMARAQCTSTKSHFGFPLVIGVLFPQVPEAVLSDQFVVLARERRNKMLNESSTTSSSLNSLQQQQQQQQQSVSSSFIQQKQQQQQQQQQILHQNALITPTLTPFIEVTPPNSLLQSPRFSILNPPQQQQQQLPIPNQQMVTFNNSNSVAPAFTTLRILRPVKPQEEVLNALDGFTNAIKIVLPETRFQRSWDNSGLLMLVTCCRSPSDCAAIAKLFDDWKPYFSGFFLLEKTFDSWNSFETGSSSSITSTISPSFTPNLS